MKAFRRGDSTMIPGAVAGDGMSYLGARRELHETEPAYRDAFTGARIDELGAQIAARMRSLGFDAAG